jgi:hypothetical protein
MFSGGVVEGHQADLLHLRRRGADRGYRDAGGVLGREAVDAGGDGGKGVE